MKNKSIRFVIVITLAHTLSYLLAGGFAYQLFTKPLWEGANPLLSAYLRTPGNTELWNFAMTWQIPSQILRGLLLGLALLPILKTLQEWKFSKRFFFFSVLVFVFTHLAAAAPSPANIEELVYVKPEFVKQGFFLMQIEMILYSLLFGWSASRWLYKPEIPTTFVAD